MGRGAYATGIYRNAYAAVDDLEKVLHEATVSAGDTGETTRTGSPSRSSRCTGPATAANSAGTALAGR
jgi:hypothetical protein